jgi:hypothetical protein
MVLPIYITIVYNIDITYLNKEIIKILIKEIDKII